MTIGELFWFITGALLSVPVFLVSASVQPTLNQSKETLPTYNNFKVLLRTINKYDRN